MYGAKTWYPKEPNTLASHYDTLYITVRDLEDIPYALDTVNVDEFECLAIDNSIEYNPNIIDYIYNEIIIGRNISEDKVLLIGMSPDFVKDIYNVAKKYNRNPIRYEVFYHFEKSVRKLHPSFNGLPLNVDRGNAEIKRKYLNFSRMYRDHRIELLNWLYNNNLLEIGYNSCPDINLATRKKESHRFVEGLRDKLPLILDTDKFVNNLGTIYDNNAGYNLLRFFKNSMFSIVTETTYKNRHYRFLTEKIWKYVVFKHSFIMVSVPYTLKLFRELGYKTFSPYINESYDTIFDDNKRMDAIKSEIQRLCSFDDTQTKKFLENVQPIVDYNYNLYFNKEKFVYRLI